MGNRSRVRISRNMRNLFREFSGGKRRYSNTAVEFPQATASFPCKYRGLRAVYLAERAPPCAPACAHAPAGARIRARRRPQGARHGLFGLQVGN